MELTKLEWYAVKALKYLMRSNAGADPEKLARRAFDIARAMVTESERLLLLPKWPLSSQDMETATGEALDKLAGIENRPAGVTDELVREVLNGQAQMRSARPSPTAGNVLLHHRNWLKPKETFCGMSVDDAALSLSIADVSCPACRDKLKTMKEPM